MLNINIVCVGRIKEKFYRDALDEYLKRLSRFARVTVSEVDDCPSDSNTAKIKATEGKAIQQKLKGYVIALDIKGNNIDSVELSELISSTATKGYGTISFVIGGSHGLDDEILKAADYRLSFGKMTFPHQLMRVILLEQIYRANMILSNSSYHK